jgi:hypothetical protein
VLNADYRPLSYLPLSITSWQEAVKYESRRAPCRAGPLPAAPAPAPGRHPRARIPPHRPLRLLSVRKDGLPRHGARCRDLRPLRAQVHAAASALPRTARRRLAPRWRHSPPAFLPLPP